jgi:dGTPase
LLLRKELEEHEKETLSPYAALSSSSRGRQRYEKHCEIRTDFQRDRDRIIHSKSFRRLKHKTQVFIAPEGDHYRTRLTHTLEVAQVARTAARSLRLNEDLTEAIALGHDLGHTPFGHVGEEALNELLPQGFKHNEQSLRVVEHLEGKSGLNLTWEVRDGILKHTGEDEPFTLEGQLVRKCDRIAYINHDIDDSLRGGILQFDELPAEEMECLGDTGSRRINTMVRDLIENSFGKPCISMSSSVSLVMESLRDFLFQNVYNGPAALVQEKKAKFIISVLYDHWIRSPEELPSEVRMNFDKYGVDRSICDYIANMTDGYIITLFEEIFVPKSWKR